VPKLINLGSACVDHVYRVTELVGAGETAASLSHEVFPGGKGLNQSLAAARAGAAVHHLGAIGEDGVFLRQVLADAGVDVDGLVERTSVASGHAVIQVNDRGENAIVIAGGANRTISEDDRSAARALLEPGDWLLLQNEINDLPAAFELCRDTGARLAFNLAPVDGREKNYDFACVDLLIVNEIEARAVAPEEIATLGDAQVASWLAAKYPDMDVVLTAGEAGLHYARGAKGVKGEEDGHIEHQPAIQVAAIDETAAGDAFIGYLLAGLLAGDAMSSALKRGAAAGACAVTVTGAASSIPEQSTVELLLSGTLLPE
jgi:ribokinase